ARAIRFLDLWQQGGWQLKLYGIAHAAERPAPELVRALERAAAALLPQPPRTPSRYGVGFACAHQGRTASIAFVDWWADEDELHHIMFVATPDGALRRARDNELSACVWDLALIGFERDAWCSAVLRNPAGPDPEAYLAARMNADV
ncbi:MAG TPA: hypothetical protein VKB80_09010, partial [Kofleriaceae bacterium]|nr:hypothetical protein [Kofleriaceae bacterium]